MVLLRIYNPEGIYRKVSQPHNWSFLCSIFVFIEQENPFLALVRMIHLIKEFEGCDFPVFEIAISV